jgi:hypothetical protein
MFTNTLEFFGPTWSSRRLVFCSKLAPQVIVDEGRKLGFQGEMQRSKGDQQWRLRDGLKFSKIMERGWGCGGRKLERRE